MRTISPMLAVCMVVCTLICNAQPKTAPSWSAKFATTINLQRVHSLGYLIVNTRDGLYGVNPDDGKIIWENKGFAGLDPEFYQEVKDNGEIASAVDIKNDREPEYDVDQIQLCLLQAGRVGDCVL